jgi:3-hydroxybutyryl-CoA dehydrogenase
VSRLAALASRPSRFVGIHFFNPVPLMALVEVVKGSETADETVAAAREFC